MTQKRKKARTKASSTKKKKKAARRKKVSRRPRFYFDREAANRALAFFDRYIRHTKGRWAGEPFDLEPWQRKIISDIFGWKNKDGTRRYRIIYIEIPRKNGKSSWGAGIAEYLLFADGEMGADVFSAAADRKQAGIIFETAKQMTLQAPALLKRADILKNAIHVPETMSKYEALSADAYTKHGLSPHGIIFDEMHAQPNRELWDVLITGRGARKQPMVVVFTTAGYDRNSICWELHEHALRVKKDPSIDETFYPVIYAADPKDDWTSPKTWKKANPNLNVSIDMDFLKVECARAQQMPAYENTFKRLYLNIWTQQLSRWIPMEAWDKITGDVDPAELKGLQCWAGLDLASTRDVAALVLVFRIGGDFKVLPFFWIPEDNMRDRVRRDKVPYDVWVQQGLMYATDGDVIDYDCILNKLVELSEIYDIQEVAYDRWGATQLVQNLQGMGLTVVPFGQGFASMSGPSKEFLNLVMAGKLHHGNHPVLRWMADNVVVKQDAAGNVKPDKSKSSQKIDGIVATVMGLGRATVTEGPGQSAYEERGILLLGGNK